jgi:DcaP outer membrane protein
MRPGSGARLAGTSFRLAVAVLLGLGGANPAWAQAPPAPQPPPAAQAPRPAIPADTPRPSQVFPDGGFPTSLPAPEGGFPAPTGREPAAAGPRAVSPPAPEGGIPAPAPKPWQDSLSPTPRTPAAEYAPPGYEPREAQEAPAALLYHPIVAGEPGAGELYIPPPLPSPDYFLPAVGPHQYADYAPPGYEPRETDEGQAPGVPEFTQITAPVALTPEERAKFVTRGLGPGSFLVPGTNTSFRLRGFVRATGLYDFNPIGSRDDFVTNTIPVPQQSGQNNNISARYSRIGLDTWTPTPIFNWNVHTFIEADFFNGPAQAVGGGGNPFRLRFAFVDFGYFRVGQQNTVFMDGNAFPNTVDFAGPRGLANLRRPSIRVTIPLCDQLFWAAGIEQPFSDITTNGLGTNVQDVPDFATHLRYETDFGHVQLSSVFRSIGYQPTDGEVTRRLGWGLSASTAFHPWAILIGSSPVRKDNPTGLERSRVLLQYTCGWGIGRYIQDTAGLGLDGQVDPTTGGFDTPWAAGWSVSYEHWFTEKWLTNLTYSAVQVGSNGGQSGTTYVGAKYLATSVWYIPIRNMSIGVEYLWGDRENLDEQRGSANRFNALMQYNF